MFSKTIGHCFYCSFYCFLKILEGKRLLRGGQKSFWGSPPIAESQGLILGRLLTEKILRVPLNGLVFARIGVGGGISEFRNMSVFSTERPHSTVKVLQNVFLEGWQPYFFKKIILLSVATHFISIQQTRIEEP